MDEAGVRRRNPEAVYARDLFQVTGAERGTRTPTSFLSPADFKLSRFAGVSEAGVRRRNPEAFCARDLFRVAGAERGTRTPTPLLKAADFKSAASANSAIPASQPF